MFSHHDKSKDTHNTDKHDDKHMKDDKHQKDSKHHHSSSKDVNAPHVSYLNEPTRQEIKAAAALGTTITPGQSTGVWQNNVLNAEKTDNSYESNQENLARNGLRQGKPIVGQIPASQRAQLEPAIQQGDLSLGLKGTELAGQRNVVATNVPSSGLQQGGLQQSNLQQTQSTGLKQHNESLGQVPLAAGVDKSLEKTSTTTQQSTHLSGQPTHLGAGHATTISSHSHAAIGTSTAGSNFSLPTTDLKLTPVVSQTTTHSSHETINAPQQSSLLGSSTLHTERVADRSMSSGTHWRVGEDTTTSTRSSGLSSGSQMMDTRSSDSRSSTINESGKTDHHIGLNKNPNDLVKNLPEGTYNQAKDVELLRQNQGINQGLGTQRM